MNAFVTWWVALTFSAAAAYLLAFAFLVFAFTFLIDGAWHSHKRRRLRSRRRAGQFVPYEEIE